MASRRFGISMPQAKRQSPDGERILDIGERFLAEDGDARASSLNMAWNLF